MIDLDNYGYHLVGDLDLTDMEYSFNILAVWKNDQGYWIASDSGCSCFFPWESLSIDSLNGPYTATEAIASITEDFNNSSGGYQDDLDDLIASIV